MENIPYGRILGAVQLGELLRASRRAQGLRQRDAAGISGVGVRFLSELERGKPTVELGRALRVLGRLGLEVWILPRGSQMSWRHDQS